MKTELVKDSFHIVFLKKQGISHYIPSKIRHVIEPKTVQSKDRIPEVEHWPFHGKFT